MAKKKIVKKAQAQQSDRTIQYVVVALALIVLGFIAWPYLPKPKSNVEVGSTPACEVFDSITAADQYPSAPPLSIDESKPYFATFKMENGGEFVVQLYSDQAPVTVNSFVFLACKGFYNGVTFHRVLDGFMAQGGDPTGTGMGDPGYAFEDEFSADLVFDRPGLLAMANSGPNTNGSQFFITYGPTEFLNGKHTIFGEVVQGMDVVNALTRRDPQQNPSFEGDAIESIVITQ
jgi:cyclophilin family peptidyl-prolyl cis-trans isomerase